MNGDLRLGFASDDFAGTKWKNLTGTARWSDGTEMVTLDYSHLTSVLWGVCKRPGWTMWKPGRPSGGRRTSRKKTVFRPPRIRGTLNSSFWGQVGVRRPPHIRGTLLKPLFGL